jgi:xylulokinase
MSTISAPGHCPEDTGHLLLGIDIGTTNCKVAIGTEDGRIIERDEMPFRLEFPRPGWVEIDPEGGWWKTLLSCLKKVSERSGGRLSAVRGITVSCTNALVCLDREGKPVRNAILQIDRRSMAEADAIRDVPGEDTIFRITGHRIAPGTFSLPTLLWIRNCEPEAFTGIDTILSPAGYVTFRLTGRRVMDRTRAATTLLYDIEANEWSETILQSLGLSSDLLPEILSSTAVAGELSAEAAALTGLSPGIPVLAGVMDSVAAAVGMGTTSPGEVGIILGTVGRVLWPMSRPSFDRRFLNVPLPESGRWIRIACANGTGLSVKWFTENLMESGTPAERLHELDASAAASPPGANGLLYLPYLAGERSPIWDPVARGVFFGLDVRHVRGDLARAVLEGTAFSIRDNLEILERESDVPSGIVRLSGGGARSPIWPHILASILSREIRIHPGEDTECRGAILLGAVGTGRETFSGAVARGKRLAGAERVVAENRDDSERYSEIFPKYRELYRHVRSLYRGVHDIPGVEETQGGA